MFIQVLSLKTIIVKRNKNIKKGMTKHNIKKIKKNKNNIIKPKTSNNNKKIRIHNKTIYLKYNIYQKHRKSKKKTDKQYKDK